MAAWKGKAQVGANAAGKGPIVWVSSQLQGQLLAEPAAGGPGVDHHLGLLKRTGGIGLQLGGEHLGQPLDPVAPVQGQQGSGREN